MNTLLSVSVSATFPTPAPTPRYVASSTRRARAAAAGTPIPTPAVMRGRGRASRQAPAGVPASVLFPSNQPVYIRGAQEMHELVSYLKLPLRSRPLVVLTTRRTGGRPWSDPAKLCRDFAVDVAVIDDCDLCFAFTDGIGRDFTVFNGAAQVYPSDDGWLDGEPMPNRVKAEDAKGPVPFDAALRQSIRRQLEREEGLDTCMGRLAIERAEGGRTVTASDGSIIGYSSQSNAAPVPGAGASAEGDAAPTGGDPAADRLLAMADVADDDGDSGLEGAGALIAQLSAASSARLIEELLVQVKGGRRRVAQLQGKVDALSAQLDKANGYAQRKADQLVQQGGQYRTMRGMFAGERERLAFERDRFDMWVREEWAARVPAGEKASRPLPASWGYEDGFFDSLESTQVSRTLVVKAVTKVLLGELRDCHPLRENEGGNAAPRRDDDGNIIWRFPVERQVAAARRLHFVRRGDVIVFRDVSGHDDGLR